MRDLGEDGRETARRRLKWLAIAILPVALLGGLLGVVLWPDDKAAAPKAAPSMAVQASAPLPTAPADWRGAINYPSLDRRIRAMMTDRSMQGLAVAVVEDGRLSFVQGYGRTAAEHGQPIGARTVFRWASLSKTVSGSLSARLASDGLFSLSDPVGVFNTSLRLPGDAQRSLTVEQLLSQQTGLSKNAYDDRLEHGGDPAAIRTALGDLSAACPPGACYSYQNVAYDTITEIIGSRTGEAYGETVARRLFAPLGMTNATLGIGGLTGAGQWARPHRNGKTLPLSAAYYRVPAAAGVNSTIVDLALWMQAQMGLRPDVLSTPVLESAQRPRIDTARPFGRLSFGRELKNAGYGLGMRSFTYRGHRLFGHSGGVSGYRSTMIFDPATRTGLVMLWNSDASLPFRLQGEFLDSAYGLDFTDWLQLKAASGAAPATGPDHDEPAALLP